MSDTRLMEFVATDREARCWRQAAESLKYKAPEVKAGAVKSLKGEWMCWIEADEYWLDAMLNILTEWARSGGDERFGGDDPRCKVAESLAGFVNQLWEANDPEVMTRTITRKSPLTGQVNTLELTASEDSWARWDARERGESRELIQKIFPEMSQADREFLKTGYTDQDWQAMFSDEEV